MLQCCLKSIRVSSKTRPGSQEFSILGKLKFDDLEEEIRDLVRKACIDTAALVSRFPSTQDS